MKGNLANLGSIANLTNLANLANLPHFLMAVIAEGLDINGEKIFQIFQISDPRMDLGIPIRWHNSRAVGHHRAGHRRSR